MSTQVNQNATLDDLAERGQLIYEKQLKSELEPDQVGRFVAIEPDSGKYFLGNTGTEALVEAHKRMPKSKFYLARVGYKAADSISGYGSRIR